MTTYPKLISWSYRTGRGLTRKYLSSAKGLPYLVKYHIGIDNTYKEMQKIRKLISTKTTVNDAKQTLKELKLIK